MRPLPVMWAKQEARELTKQEELNYEDRYTEWLADQEKLRRYQEYQEYQDSKARSFYGTNNGDVKEPDVDEWYGEQLHHLSDFPKADLDLDSTFTFPSASDGKHTLLVIVYI